MEESTLLLSRKVLSNATVKANGSGSITMIFRANADNITAREMPEGVFATTNLGTTARILQGYYEES